MNNGDQRTEEIKENYRKGLVLKNVFSAEAMVKTVPYGVQEAVNCIHEHLYDPRLTVKWMKEQCYSVNGRNFASKFKYFAGETPRNYWVKHRIETAKILLKDEVLANVSVNGIAFDLGFNTPQAFSTTFKKYAGCSPKAFRECKY